MTRPDCRTRLALLIAFLMWPLAALSGCGEGEESAPPRGADSNPVSEASDNAAAEGAPAADEQPGSAESENGIAGSNEPTDGDRTAEASDSEGEADPKDDSESDGDAAAATAADAAFEADLAEVEALAVEADFVAAYDLARRLRVKYGGHPRRAEVEALLSRMKSARAQAVEMPYMLEQLGSEDTESRAVARRKLINHGDVAAIFLRNAVRDGAAENAKPEQQTIASEAARLLGAMGQVGEEPGDTQTGLLFANLLADGVNDPLRAALVEALSGVAGQPRAEVLHPVYPLVAEDEDHERRALAGYLIQVVAPEAGDDAEAWADLLGDAAAYETIRAYVEAAQRSPEPDMVAWANQFTAELGLYEQGLKGEYFQGTDFQEPLRVALVERISFTRDGNPIPEIPRDDISARWTGKVRVTRGGEYTFYASTDDGVRLWVNGEQLIDAWTMRGESEDSATITLEPGLHDLKMEWMQGAGGYACHLRWSGPETEKQIIPPDHLRVAPWAADRTNADESE